MKRTYGSTQSMLMLEAETRENSLCRASSCMQALTSPNSFSFHGFYMNLWFSLSKLIASLAPLLSGGMGIAFLFK
ncbi:uncharacterized protein DS421_11g344120 [Arachis hypogaea]|nr:uncharacterized protein DS421_11g344120 [Arachis hypogaea]